ncbi:hypothetical protein ACWCOZ_18755 [Streptomyces sp. NPDC001840]
MSTDPTVHPEETGTREINYRGARVRVAGPLALVESLRGPFVSYGAEMVAADRRGAVPMVSVRQVRGTPEGPEWDSLRLPHGGGDTVAVPRGVSVVHGGPPLSIVTVAESAISVAQYGATPHLPFVHYLAKYPLRHAVEQQGAVLAHSAAVEIVPGSCCLFLGPSGAGKTTVFVEMVTCGLRALGNDATLLAPLADGRVEAAAWPHLVRIGEATVNRNRVLGALPGDWAPRNRRDGKAEVFFDALDELFARPIAAPPARVTAVVDLGLDTAGTGLDVTRLDPAETHSFIGERLIEDRLPTGWLPGWTWQPDPAPVRTVADLLTDRTPMYRVRAGVATSGWADQLADWVRSLEPHTTPAPALTQ